MSNVTPEMAASFLSYIEVAGYFFSTAHKTAITLGMNDALATIFAKQLLEHAMAPKQDQAKEKDFSSLIARMSPGGIA